MVQIGVQQTERNRQSTTDRVQQALDLRGWGPALHVNYTTKPYDAAAHWTAIENVGEASS